MPDEEKKGDEMSFFGQVGSELAPLTPEQEAEIAALKKEGMGEDARGLPITYPRIKMLHGDFRSFQFVATEEMVKEFRAIIIHIEASRVWWEKPLGQGEGGQMPDCFSRDLMLPDAGCEMQQADKCAKCPQNQWESDVKADGSRGRGKACKEIRRIFLMAEGHLSPHWMSIPPSSLRALGSHLTTVADKKFNRVQEVVTTFKLATKKNKEGVAYSELALAVGERIPDRLLYMVVDWKKKIVEMLRAAAPVSREEYGDESAK